MSLHLWYMFPYVMGVEEGGKFSDTNMLTLPLLNFSSFPHFFQISFSREGCCDFEES